MKLSFLLCWLFGGMSQTVGFTMLTVSAPGVVAGLRDEGTDLPWAVIAFALGMLPLIGLLTVLGSVGRRLWFLPLLRSGHCATARLYGATDEGRDFIFHDDEGELRLVQDLSTDPELTEDLVFYSSKRSVMLQEAPGSPRLDTGGALTASPWWALVSALKPTAFIAAVTVAALVP